MSKIITKKTILASVALAVLGGALGALYSWSSLPSQNLMANLLTPPQTYFTSERPVHAVFLSQKDTKGDDLNRNNLNHASVTLFNSLKKNQQALKSANPDFPGYDRIVVIFNPNFPQNDPDPFQAQANFTFPQAKYSTLHPTKNQKESDLYPELSYHSTAGTLYILQSYLNFTDFDPAILQLEKAHYKDAFDNLSKASLATIAFTNSEAVKAVYQLAKEAGALKALPTLEDQTNQYQIKFLAEGSSTPTDNLNLTFIGDIMLGRNVQALMNKYGQDYPFTKMDESYLQMNDLLIANLEGPVTDKAVRTSKAIAFRFLPAVVDLLKKYHFDVLSQANNHTLDMGENGLADSYRLLTASQDSRRAGILADPVNLTPFGHPRDLNDPRSAVLFNLHGSKIAFLGLNNTDFKLVKTDVVAKIKSLTEQDYQVIPFIHWGTEYVHTPGAEQVDLAHAFIDAGAIAVFGMHPHVVESVEVYNNAPIFYSLGNGIFDQYFSTDTQEGLTVTARLTQNEMDFYLLPIKIEMSQFRLMNPDEKTVFLQKLADWWRYDQKTKDQILKGEIVIKLPNN